MNRKLKIALTIFLAWGALGALASFQILFYTLIEPTEIYSEIFRDHFSIVFYVIAPISSLIALVLGWTVSERYFWFVIPSALSLLWLLIIGIFA